MSQNLIDSQDSTKDISENIQLKELELLVERKKSDLALKQADIELLKLKQNHNDTQMYR